LTQIKIDTKTFSDEIKTKEMADKNRSDYMAANTNLEQRKNERNICIEHIGKIWNMTLKILQLFQFKALIYCATR
jgi:hypothetical protein